MSDQSIETELQVGPSVIDAYSRLSYTMWHALAEFIDNSTQSRLNYSGVIEDVLAGEGRPLTVEINYDRLAKVISIEDNSIGMTRDDLIQALRIANPTKDSRGRSKYGLGMKTAACWIGSKWDVITKEWDSGVEWTACIDVNAVVNGKKIQLTPRAVNKSEHGTKIVIRALHRFIQKRSEETIINYLGSMYRFDIRANKLKLIFNGVEIRPPDELDFDADPTGKPMQRFLPETTINGKKIQGWVAVLRRGGRKFGGFSLFQEERQIQGFPNAWKPKSIFGGVDDEGANNLVSQRLTGLIDLDGFKVSHTKDAILFEGDEEEELERLLQDFTKDYRTYAARRRGPAGQPWARDKVREMLAGLKKEFTNPELQDAFRNSLLPPLETIIRNNQQQAQSLPDADVLTTWELPGLKVIVAMQEKSEHEPYLTITTAAEAGKIYVILNGLHPYYGSIESMDASDECIRQYIYDAIAEYRVSNLGARVVPDSVRRLKDTLLRAQITRVENAAGAQQEGEPPKPATEATS